MTKEQIIIAVDPGFDANKVIVGNGNNLKDFKTYMKEKKAGKAQKSISVFAIPNDIVDVTDNNVNILGTAREGHILTEIDNRKYLVGEEARALKLQNELDQQMADQQAAQESYERFKTDLFERELLTCIATALIKYSDLSIKADGTHTFDINAYSAYCSGAEDRDKSLDDYYANVVIRVGLALPNDLVEIDAPSLRSKLNGLHRVKIELGSKEQKALEYDLCFKIDEKHCAASSQVIMAFLGLMTDDEGNIYPEDISEADDDRKIKFNRAKDLPLVMIDGGYRTMGIFQLGQNLNVVDAESKQEYAMHVVSEKVAQIFSEKYNLPEFKSYKIERFVQEERDGNRKPQKVWEEDGSVKRVSIEETRDHVIDEVCESFIDYIYTKYKQFAYIDNVMITGGTGGVYFDSLAKYLKAKADVTPKLIEYRMCGVEITPTFAISAGMYKMMLSMLNPRQ